MSDKKISISTRPFMAGYNLSFDGHGINRIHDAAERYPQRIAKITGQNSGLHDAEIMYFGRLFESSQAMLDILNRLIGDETVTKTEIMELIVPLQNVEVWSKDVAEMSSPSGEDVQTG